MPLYEYECQECGERSEVVQKFSDDPLTICSSCGGSLRKLMSAPAIQFKGSGFYLTDYGRAGGSETKPASSDAKPSAAETKSSPASDSAPAKPSTD